MSRWLFVLVMVGCSSDGGNPQDSGGTDVATATDAQAETQPSGDAATDATDAIAPTCTAKPDATNTGVPKNVTLTQVNTDVTVTQDDAVIDAQDIHGFLIIKANRVHVMRSIVRGKATAATTAAIRINSGTDILIEDTEVSIDTPSVDVDGVSGSNFTARRMNIHGGVDGMKLGDNSTVECSYIHDLASFASDPNQGGGATHNDCIQILAGTTIAITHNQLVAAKDQNSAIQVTQDFGAVGFLHIASNWADGGGCTFNISHKGLATLTNVFTDSNRFGRNSYFGCPILKSTQTTLVSTNDVWDDNNMPVPIQTHD